MSHQDYIAELDEGQLNILAHFVKERQKAIRENGYVMLWKVSDEWCDRCWFAEDQHREAFEKMIEFAHADYKPGQHIHWNLEKTRMHPSEAAEALRVNVPMEKL